MFLGACVPYKKALYMNDLREREAQVAIAKAEEIPLVSGDLVEIYISSISRETSEFFYKPGGDPDTKSGANVYQIGANGSVDLPLVGMVELAGKQIEEAEELLRIKLADYLQKPTVNLRLINFQVTVLGEVARPGTYRIPSGRSNLLEALGSAGDITLFGERGNVLLIRGEGPDSQYFRINLNESEFLQNPQYHLKNNDIIYVPPTRGRTSADDNVYRLLPLVLSGLTFVAVIISLLSS